MELTGARRDQEVACGSDGSTVGGRAKTGGDLEQKRMDGSSFKLEVMQKVPERVVQERVSQGRGVKGLKEKKKVSGWSLEEMKEKPNIAVEEKTEEMKNERSEPQRNGPMLGEFG